MIYELLVQAAPFLIGLLLGIPIYFFGKRSASKNAELAQEVEYRETRAKIDKAEKAFAKILVRDHASARDWLHERSKQRRDL